MEIEAFVVGLRKQGEPLNIYFPGLIILHNELYLIKLLVANFSVLSSSLLVLLLVPLLIVHPLCILCFTEPLFPVPETSAVQKTPGNIVGTSPDLKEAFPVLLERHMPWGYIEETPVN